MLNIREAIQNEVQGKIMNHVQDDRLIPYREDIIKPDLGFVNMLHEQISRYIEHALLVVVPDNLYHMPCEKGIEAMKRARIKVALIATSVPYNIGIKYDNYKDDRPRLEYINGLKEVFDQCRDILKEGGTVAINVADSKNGSIPLHSDIIQFMTKELDYLFVTTIIWDKKQIANRLAWGSFMSPSCPSYPTPFEYILLFRYKNKKHKGNKEDITITREEFKECAYAIWSFSPETKTRKLGHPCAYPLELPNRLIQMNTYRGDIVLDPFSGIGTTALAAKNTGRRYIGFEISKTYHEIALNRLMNSQNILDALNA